jgi:hypothetical protein
MAQVIRGRVVDRARGTPIPSVAVSLSDSSGQLLASDVTDASGAFEIEAPGVRVCRLALKRVGYQSRELALELGAESVVHVPQNVSALDAVPVELEEVTVTGPRSRKLEVAGFYQRRNEGHGSFITRGEFDPARPSQTTDVLRRLQGLRINPNPKFGSGRAGSSVAPRYLLETSRGAPGLGYCPPALFVNGSYIGTAAETDIDLVIRVNDIEAIEVYSGAGQFPARFNVMGSLCGAVVIWTQ